MTDDAATLKAERDAARLALVPLARLADKEALDILQCMGLDVSGQKPNQYIFTISGVDGFVIASITVNDALAAQKAIFGDAV